jgi:hypothetical protein
MSSLQGKVASSSDELDCMHMLHGNAWCIIKHMQ